MNKIAEKYKKNINIIYLIFCTVPIILVAILSDLPTAIGGWSDKSAEILAGNAPKSNFYPAGSSIMLIPFLWNTPNFFVGILFYYLAGAHLYWKICVEIINKKMRVAALLALPLNPYLIWLFYSSQDTVFEFFLLMLIIFSILKYRVALFIFSGYLLCLTRPSYWIMFLTLGFFVFLKNKHLKIRRYIFLIPIALVPLNSLYNFAVYDSFSPANESGITAYFSYNKYYYLAHPKFDMDVFLSTGEHMNVPNSELLSESQLNSKYLDLAINSIISNPKTTILGSLQKIDSYIFDIQKIPHLPGEYFLNKNADSIIIGDERLDWQFIFGNLLFAFERASLLVLFLFTLILFVIYNKSSIFAKIKYKAVILLIPWMSGLIPGILFYTETRFKIVSELLLVPFVALILSTLPPRLGIDQFKD